MSRTLNLVVRPDLPLYQIEEEKEEKKEVDKG